MVGLRAGVPELPVHLIDFPYRREGRGFPDRAPKLIASIVDEATRVAAGSGIEPERLVLGGRSMGGRMASMAIADGLPAAGVVLIAYPLHPPRRPDRARTAHLGELTVPSLWLCGDRDPFGTPEELADAQALVAGPVTSRTLSGRHELDGAEHRILSELRDWLGLRRRPGSGWR